MIIQNQAVRLLLAKCDTGAGKKGAENGPDALLAALKKHNIIFDDCLTLDALSVEEDPEMKFCKHVETVSSNAQRLNDAVIASVKDNKKTIVFSGDHSNAIGGLSGFVNAQPDKSIGVIWIDAHADLHSPYTTPSGNMHGMPLAALLATNNLSQVKNGLSEKEKEAWDNLKQTGGDTTPKISAKNIVFIALRDAEPEEWHLIDENNIKNFEPEYIKEHGIYNVINNSLKHLDHCDSLYVSFDVDSMDPSMADGTGTPVDNGLSKAEAEAVLKTLIHHPKTGLVEITEINPSLDTRPIKMAELTAEILASALKV
jgi:arginase